MIFCINKAIICRKHLKCCFFGQQTGANAHAQIRGVARLVTSFVGLPGQLGQAKRNGKKK